MSRTKKGHKGPGYDYGSRRPGNRGYCNSPKSQGVKTLTHRLERRQADRIVRIESSVAEAERAEWDADRCDSGVDLVGQSDRTIQAEGYQGTKEEVLRLCGRMEPGSA